MCVCSSSYPFRCMYAFKFFICVLLSSRQPWSSHMTCKPGLTWWMLSYYFKELKILQNKLLNMNNLLAELNCWSTALLPFFILFLSQGYVLFLLKGRVIVQWKTCCSPRFWLFCRKLHHFGTMEYFVKKTQPWLNNWCRNIVHANWSLYLSSWTATTNSPPKGTGSPQTRQDYGQL